MLRLSRSNFICAKSSVTDVGKRKCAAGANMIMPKNQMAKSIFLQQKNEDIVLVFGDLMGFLGV